MKAGIYNLIGAILISSVIFVIGAKLWDQQEDLERQLEEQQKVLQVQLEMQHADLTNVIQSIAVAINSSLTTNSLAREEWALEQRKIFNLEVFRHRPQAGPIPDVAPLGEPVFPIDD